LHSNRFGEVEKRLGKVVLENNSLLKMLNRLIITALLKERVAKIVLDVGVHRPLHHRPADKIDRQILAPAIDGKNAKQIQGIRLIRHLLENHPVQPLGFFPATGFVVLNRFIHQALKLVAGLDPLGIYVRLGTQAGKCRGLTRTLAFSRLRTQSRERRFRSFHSQCPHKIC